MLMYGCVYGRLCHLDLYAWQAHSPCIQKIKEKRKTINYVIRKTVSKLVYYVNSLQAIFAAHGLRLPRGCVRVFMCLCVSVCLRTNVFITFPLIN